MKFIFPLVLGACLIVAAEVHSQPQTPTASPGQQVLRECAKTYQSLREFKGDAAVIEQASIEIKKEVQTPNIQTADASFDFVRGEIFQIEGHDASREAFSILNTPLKTLASWQDKGKTKTETPKNLELAVAGFTGVAAGAPTTVPALLLSSGWGFPFVVEDKATLKGTG